MQIATLLTDTALRDRHPLRVIRVAVGFFQSACFFQILLVRFVDQRTDAEPRCGLKLIQMAVGESIPLPQKIFSSALSKEPILARRTQPSAHRIN